MPEFKKGQSGNPKGKPKGTLNKQTREIKEVINHLVSAMSKGELNDMLKTLFRDKPEAVLGFLAKIAPKDLTINSTEDSVNPIAEQIRLLRESKK